MSALAPPVGGFRPAAPREVSFAAAHCGPECSHAVKLPAALGEWVWCDLHGGPRWVGKGASLCRGFASGPVARPAAEPAGVAR